MQFEHILLLAAYAALFILIPVALSFIVLRMVKKKGYHPKWKLLAIVPIIIMIYSIATAADWRYKLYKEHFKEVTSLEFPEGAEFIEVESWEEGTYFKHKSTVSTIRIGKEPYTTLPITLRGIGLIRNNPEAANNEGLSYRLQKMIEKTDGLEILESFSAHKIENQSLGHRAFYYVGLLSDGKSIIVYARFD